MINPLLEETLLAWYNIVGEGGSLQFCTRLEDLWRKHIPLFLSIISKDPVAAIHADQQEMPPCALSCYDQAMTFLERKLTTNENPALLKSVNTIEASKGNKYQLSKILSLVSFEMTVACGAEHMKQLIEHMETKVKKEIIISLNKLLTDMEAALDIAEDTDTEDHWNKLLIETEETFVGNVPDDSINFAVPSLTTCKTPVKSMDIRRQTISGAASLRKDRNEQSDVADQSIYCTPRGPHHRKLQANKPPGSPTTQLLEFVSSPVMKEKRATRALAEATKKIHELEDQLQYAVTSEIKMKNAVDVASTRLQEEKSKCADVKQSLLIANETINERDSKISMLEKHIRELERSNEGKTLVQEKTKQIVSELERQKMMAEQVVEELKIEKSKLNTHVKDALDENIHYRNQIIEITQKCTELERSLNSVIREKDEYVNLYETNKVSSRQQLMKAEEEYQFEMNELRNSTAATIRRLEEDLEQAHLDRQSKAKSLADALSQIDEIREKAKRESTNDMEEMKRMEAEVLRVNETLRAVQKKLDCTEDGLSAAERTNLEERKKIREMEVEVLKTHATNKVIVEENRKFLEQLSSEQENRERLVVVLKEVETATFGLKDQLEQKIEEAAHSFKKIENLERELEESKSKLYDEYLEHDKLRKRISEKEKELEEQGKEIGKYELAQSIANEEMEKLKSINEHQRMKISGVERKLATEQELSALLREQLGELQKIGEEQSVIERQVTENRIRLAEERATKAEESKVEMSRVLEDIEKLKSVAENKVEEYKKITLIHKAEMSTLSDDMKAMKLQISENRAENDVLRRQNLDLEERIKELEIEHNRAMKDQKFRADAYIDELKAKIEKEVAKNQQISNQLQSKNSEVDAESIHDETIRHNDRVNQNKGTGQMYEVTDIGENNLRASAGRSDSNLIRRISSQMILQPPDLDCFPNDDDEEPYDMESKLLDGSYADIKVDFNRVKIPLVRSQNNKPKEPSSGEQLQSLFDIMDKKNAASRSIPTQESQGNFDSVVPRNHEFVKEDSEARLRELNARNLAMPRHLRSSYAVETSGFSPKYNEEELRHSDRFEPVKLSKYENSGVKEKDGKRRSMMHRLNSFARPSKGKNTPLKEKN